MRKEMGPAVAWISVVLVVLLVVFLGFKFMSGPAPNPDKKGADDAMTRVQQGGKLYEPPADAPVPGAGGKRPDGKPGGMGGYSMQPPSH